MTAWGDVSARARGLSTHLLVHSDLMALAEAPDLTALVEALAARGLVSVASADPVHVERALRRVRADRLALIARWCGTREGLLAVAVDDEDRRSIEHLLRVVAAGQGGEDAVAGLTPTPRLPERALVTLAEQRTVERVVDLLVAWGHPLGPPLLAPTDPLARDRALHAAFAARLAAAARQGDAPLREFVAAWLDVENALQVVVQRRQPAETRDPEAFLPGGASLDRATWTALLEGDVLDEAALTRALGPALAAAVRSPDAEGRVLRVQVEAFGRRARQDPLSTAPVLAYLLRLRAEAVDLRTVVWGVALGAPPGAIQARLVTP